MKLGSSKIRTSSLVVAGLLVLAGAASDGRDALAQTPLECPVPPGVTPPADPPVTAQQVEDGSATLEEFTLAAIRHFKEGGAEVLTPQQLAYSGCRLRQEGGPWRSGSTYIVTLTSDGRVYLHARDMSLSAGKLKPSIYAGLLRALRTPAAVLAGLRSADPATRASAQAMLLAHLASEPHGAFNLTGRVSGHAGAYRSVNTGRPLVLLAGFDLNASHLEEEQIDYGSPAVTARDVVDRETLRAFVGEALRFIAGTQQNVRSTAESRVAFQKARLALRDPNGPWRHGSVYIYIVDGNSNLVLFHGGFPNRHELRPVGITRDVVTGELIYDQLVAAARSSPEGGFWRYHFDNPADDTDSAEVPKLGFAREFVRTTGALDGTEIRTNLIIASGVYLSSPEVVAARQNTVVETILPQVMRAMTAGTVDAVSDRIQQAGSSAPPAMGFSFGGASTLSDAVLSHGQALADGTLDPGRLLAGSSFTLPLNAAADGGGGRIGNLTLWGSGNYRNFSGGNPQTLDYDGDVVSGNLGVDTRLSENLLAGMSLAHSRGEVDYTDSYALTGEFTSTLTSIHPYVGWRSAGGMNLWATAGYGWGEVEVDDETANAQASDLTQQMAAAGVSGPLVASEGVIEGGTTSLRLRAETAFTWADVDGSGTLRSATLNTSRQRLMLEGSHVQKLASGATFTPSLEFGLRHDGGDGETGNSLEVGGGLRYAVPASGLTIEGRARTLLHHSGDYEEWGVSALVRIAPGTAGRGLALSVRPAWGQSESGVERMWESDGIAGAARTDQLAGRMGAEIGYGFGMAPGLGVVTPYSGLVLASEGARSWRMGTRWQLAPTASLSLEGTRHETGSDDGAEHNLMLRGAVRW